jgi:hypothetical protein
MRLDMSDRSVDKETAQIRGEIESLQSAMACRILGNPLAANSTVHNYTRGNACVR